MNYSNTEEIFNSSLSIVQNKSLQNETIYAVNLEDKVYDFYYETVENHEYNFTFPKDALTAFSEGYREVHYYLCLIVCIFGFITNILNTIVFRKKNMISPINSILTGLAVADLIFVSSEIPLYVRHITTDHKKNRILSYGWIVFELFLENCELVTHTISTWLTITVGVWRLIGISFPITSKNWLNMTRAKIAIISTYVISTLFCIPYFISYTVREYEEDGEFKYESSESEILQWNMVMQDYNFWFLSVAIQLLPCLSLAILTLGLICVLCKANRQRKKLTNRSETKTHDRTTKMLLAVLMIFLITKLPLGIIVLLGLIIGDSFFNASVHFLDICVLLLNINSSINFVVFFSMSQNFRDTFTHVFRLNAKQWSMTKDTASTNVAGAAGRVPGS